MPAAPTSAGKLKHTNFYQKYPRDQLAALFEEVCSIFHHDLDEAKDFDVDAIMDDVNRSNANDETQTTEFIRRNLRIKPKKGKAKPETVPSDAEDDDDNAFDATAALGSNKDSPNSSHNNSFTSFSDTQSQAGN